MTEEETKRVIKAMNDEIDEQRRRITWLELRNNELEIKLKKSQQLICEMVESYRMISTETRDMLHLIRIYDETL